MHIVSSFGDAVCLFLIDGCHVQPIQRSMFFAVTCLPYFPVCCSRLRFPSEDGYRDAECITFPWVIDKKDFIPEELDDLEDFLKAKYGQQS